jgi:ferritin-like metal-binding protein YciE
MPHYQPKIQDVIEAKEVFHELQQTRYLMDAINEALCNGNQETISDQIRYLFSLLIKETEQGLNELEQALDILSGKE